LKTPRTIETHEVVVEIEFHIPGFEAATSGFEFNLTIANS